MACVRYPPASSSFARTEQSAHPLVRVLWDSVKRNVPPLTDED